MTVHLSSNVNETYYKGALVLEAQGWSVCLARNEFSCLYPELASLSNFSIQPFLISWFNLHVLLGFYSFSIKIDTHERRTE